MYQHIIEDKVFDNSDYSKETLVRASYEYCKFNNCNFEKVNLSEFRFIECEFNNCNLSLAILAGTALQEVKFKGCKMVGLHFEDCHEFSFSVSFENCILNNSTFFRSELAKTNFVDTKLQDVDFTESNLKEAVFNNCDLDGAIFEKTKLEKADFKSAINYQINPEMNQIKKAKFSILGLPGLLSKYDIEIS
jgi:fluoroquinolone resistance protein